MDFLKVVFKCIVVFLLFSGCESEKKSYPSNPVPQHPKKDGASANDGNTAEPVNSKKIAWGDLKCQTLQRCKTVPLNIEKSELQGFLVKFFSDPIEGEKLLVIFRCGKKWQKLWSEQFPLYNGETHYEISELSRFGYGVLDVQTCKLKPGLLTNINDYFLNTEEYKNEF